MDRMELMESRHSVRQYLKKEIEEEKRQALDMLAEQLSEEGRLHIQILYEEPECFDSRMAHYGHFENVRNYMVLAGKKEKDLDERCGYYGEQLVLKAQELGLNTCWVALTHGKSKALLEKGEKEVILISLGYGKNQGSPHRNRNPERLSDLKQDDPEWYKEGVKAALLAPTATNQQKFRLERNGSTVSAKVTGISPYIKLDLGIVKYHFELGAGTENFRWA